MKVKSKKDFLELLIKSFGLTPKGIEPYRTSSAGGQYKVKTGWKGEAYDNDGEIVINLFEPDGFNMAVHEILRKAKTYNLDIKYISDDE